MKNLKRKKEMSMFELVDILATPDLRGKLYNFLVKALDAPFEDLDDIRYWLETPVQCGEEIQKYVHKRVAAMEAEHAKMTRCNCPAKSDEMDFESFMEKVVSGKFGDKVQMIDPSKFGFDDFFKALTKAIMPEEFKEKADVKEESTPEESTETKNEIVIPEGDSLSHPELEPTCKPFSQLSKNQKIGIKKKVNKYVAEGINDLAFIANSLLGDNPFDSTVQFVSNVINGTAKRIAQELAKTNPSAIDKLEDIENNR